MTLSDEKSLHIKNERVMNVPHVRDICKYFMW